MTRKEARTKLEDIAKNMLWGCGEYSEALDIAIEALKQDSKETLDKIREEIDQVEINGHIRDVECFEAGIKVALNIIDKYRESEE